MDIQETFANARMHYLRLVINALGPERMAKAMTAFEDGSSNWSECFFARAFQGEVDLNRQRNIEGCIKDMLGLKTLVPIRFTWQAFDSIKGTGLTRAEMEAMVTSILHDDKVDKQLAKLLDFNFNPDLEVTLDCVVPQADGWVTGNKRQLL